MAVKTIRDALVADAGVTALVGARISPLIKAQAITLPAITLQRSGTTPQNHLRGHAGVDDNRVQLDAWASTYDLARQVAAAARAALQAAGHFCESELPDDYDPETETYRVIQEWSVWTT